MAPLAQRSCARPSKAVADTGPEEKHGIQQEGLLAASSISSPVGARLSPPQQEQATAEGAKGQHSLPKWLPAVSNSRNAVDALSQAQQRKPAPSGSPLTGQAGPGAAEQQHVHQQVLAKPSSSSSRRAPSQHQEPAPLRSPVTGEAALEDTVPDTPISSRAGSLPRGSGGSQGLLPTQDGIMWALPSLASQPGKALQPDEVAQAGSAQPVAQPAAACQELAVGSSSGGRQAPRQTVPASASAAAEAPAHGLYADSAAARLAATARPVARRLQGVPAATSIMASATAQAMATPPQAGQGQQQQLDKAAALPVPAPGPCSLGSGALGQTAMRMGAAAAMSLTPAAYPRAGPWPQQQSAGGAVGLGKRKQPEAAFAEAGVSSRTDSGNAAHDSSRQGQGKRAAVGPQQQRVPAPAAGSPVAAVRPAQPVTPARKSPGPAKAGRGASKPSRLQCSSGGQSGGAHLKPQRHQAMSVGQAAAKGAKAQRGQADCNGLATGQLGELQRPQAATAGLAARAHAQAQQQKAAFDSQAGAACQQPQQVGTSELAASAQAGPQLPRAGSSIQALQADAAPQLPQGGPHEQASEPWGGEMSVNALPLWMATSGDEPANDAPAELLQVAAGAAIPYGLQATVKPPTEVGEPPLLVDDPMGAAPAGRWQLGAAGAASAEVAAPVWPHQQGTGSPSGRGTAAPAAAAQAAGGQQSGAPASSSAGTTWGFLSRPDPNPHGLRPGRASLLGTEGPIAAQAAAGGGAWDAVAGAPGPSSAPVAGNRWLMSKIPGLHVAAVGCG